MRFIKRLITLCLFSVIIAFILCGCTHDFDQVSNGNEVPGKMPETLPGEKDITGQNVKENIKSKGKQEETSVQEINDYPVVEGNGVLLSSEESEAFYNKICLFTDEKCHYKIVLPTKGMHQEGDPACWNTYPVIISGSDAIELKKHLIFYRPWDNDTILREPIKYSYQGIPIFIRQKYPQELVALIDWEPVEINVGLEQIWDFKPHPSNNQIAVYGSDRDGLFKIVIADIDSKSLTTVFSYKNEMVNASEKVNAELDFDSNGNLYFDTYYAKEKGIYIYNGQKTEKFLNKAYLPRVSPNSKHLAFYQREKDDDYLSIWDIDKKTVIGRMKKWGNPIWALSGEQLYIEKAREIIKVSLGDNGLVAEGIHVDGIPFVFVKENPAKFYLINQDSINRDPVVKKVNY